MTLCAPPPQAPSPLKEQRIWASTSFDGFSLLRATYYRHRFRYHSQDSFVFATNLRGQAACFKGGEVTVAPGRLAVIPPGRPHGGRRLGEDAWVYLAAYPAPDFLEEILRDLTGDRVAEATFRHLVYDDGEMASRFVEAHRAFLCGEDPLRGETALVAFLTAFIDRYCVFRRRPMRILRRRGAIAGAVDYIEENLDTSLSLAEIAAESSYSRYHFLRVFKDLMGQTPFAYLMQRRVERAKELLQRGVPIAAAACDTGFSDQAHLTRRFKQLVGVTPGEFARGAGRSGAQRHSRQATAS